MPAILSPLLRQGEAGTGNVVEAVRHARAVQGAIRQLQTMDDDELYVYAKVSDKQSQMKQRSCLHVSVGCCSWQGAAVSSAPACTPLWAAAGWCEAQHTCRACRGV